VVARNTAFAAAQGRFIVGLDQDDLCHRDRFSTQHAWLEAHPDAVLVASAVDLLESGVIRPPRAPVRSTPGLIDWRLQFGNPLVWSSVMFRADAVRRLGVFERVDRRYAEDFDLYHRLRALGTLARIDRPLVTYRIHPGGASRRYTQAMDHSATAVLAEVYAALFGADADQAARLVLIHFTGGVPVADRATLDRLARLVGVVHDRFCATCPMTPVDRALIIAEYARLWWRMADASVRSGAVSLDEAAAACPTGLRARHPSPRRAFGSVVIGTARALFSRWKAFAL
jgi:glycosyltransferase involved in cell wall biosynthesis